MTRNKDRLYDRTCTICMEDFKINEDLSLTSCKHSFHHVCLNGWIDKKIDDTYLKIMPK